MAEARRGREYLQRPEAWATEACYSGRANTTKLAGVWGEPDYTQLASDFRQQVQEHCSAWSLSHISLCDPWTAAHQASLSITISQSLVSTELKFMSIESVMIANRLILCCPLDLPSVFAASESFPVGGLFASGAVIADLQ